MADWRADNAHHTRGAVLRWRKYTQPSESWDHDHCEGCWAKFMESGVEGALAEGYATDDDRWICSDCYHDLKQDMGWKLSPDSE